MPYIIIAAVVALVEIFGLLARPVSFDFIPLLLRLAIPLVIAAVGIVRADGMRTVADVLLGVLLLMLWNAAYLGSQLDQMIATVSVAVMAGVAGGRAIRDHNQRLSAFGTAWSGLLAAVVLFMLVVGAVRALGLVDDIGRQLR